MAKKGGNPQNLKTPSTEQARIIGSMGGKRSAEVKKEKKLMSQIYGEFLAERFNISVDGEEIETTGADLIATVVKGVLSAGGSPAVSLMKEIREATEGNKTELSGSVSTPILNIVVENADRP